MLDIGWTELLVIAVVLIVVVGPKDLPPMLRAFGKMTANLRKMAGDFRTQFDNALREADMDDVRQTISDVQKFHPANAIREAINPLREMGNEIRNDLQKATTLPASSGSEAADTSDNPEVAKASVEDLLPASSLGLPETPLATQPPAGLANPAASSPAQQPTVDAPKPSGKPAKAAGVTNDTEQAPAKAPARKRPVKATAEKYASSEAVAAKPARARKPAVPKTIASAEADVKPAAGPTKTRKKPTTTKAKATKQVDVPKDEA